MSKAAHQGCRLKVGTDFAERGRLYLYVDTLPIIAESYSLNVVAGFIPANHGAAFSNGGDKPRRYIYG